MATIKGDYWQFYLDGRLEKRQLKSDIDEDALVEEMVRMGAPLRDTISAACDRAAAPLVSGKAKRQWIDEHKDEIKDAGGDSDAAYAAYLLGRTDDLAYDVEEAVIGALDQRFGGEDDDEDAEDDDDEEGGAGGVQ